MELNIIEGPIEEEIRSSEELFQQFTADSVESLKKRTRYKTLKHVIEKDHFFFVNTEGQKISLIQHEKELSDELQKQLNTSFFVIRFQDNKNKTVYRVLQGSGNARRGVSFTDQGNGVILYSPGMLTRDMDFVTFGIASTQLYTPIVEGFRKAVSTLPTFRLHAVTGNLRFEKM